MRPPDKQRYLDAVRRVPRLDIPFQENDIDPVVARQLLGRDLPLVAPYRLPVADNVALALTCGNDLVYTACPWSLGRKTMTDADGRVHYVDGTIKGAADLRAVRPPALDDARRRLEETLTAVAGAGLGVCWSLNEPAALVTTAVGYQDYYIALLADPGFIHDFQALVEDYCLRELAMVLDYPVDVVQLGATLCMKSGPMISRALLEEFEFPTLRRQVAMVKACGRVVSFHSDGDNTALIPDFIALGIDVFNPVEPCDGQQDIFALKARYGDRLALHGNIDLTGVLRHGTPENVTRDVRAHLDRLAPGGGYVCASSHNITADIPLANFLAMRDTVHEYRSEGE